MKLNVRLHEVVVLLFVLSMLLLLAVVTEGPPIGPAFGIGWIMFLLFSRLGYKHRQREMCKGEVTTSVLEKFKGQVLQRTSDPEIAELRNSRKASRECLVTIGNNAHLDSLGYNGKLDSINALNCGWGIRVYFKIDRTTGAILSAKAVPFQAFARERRTEIGYLGGA